MALPNNDKLVTLQRLTTAVNAISSKIRELYVAKADAGVYENIIESVSVNGSALTPDLNKNVDITVPTKVSDLTNDSNFQTDTEVQNAIATAISVVYKPAGSVASVAELPALAAGVLGNVYNFTAGFETTADFVEGAGKTYPVGTDVAIVDVDTTGESPVYKYNALAGFVDLSDYLSTSDAGAGISISAQGKIEIDPTKFETTGLGISVANDIVSLDLSASTVTSLALADSAVQSVSAGDGITVTDDGSNNVTVAAKLKEDSVEVGSEFTNLLKVDENGKLYVDTSDVQGNFSGVDNNGAEVSVTNGNVETTLHVSDKAGNLLQIVAADAVAGTTKGLFVGLEYATDEEVTAIVDAAFSDSSDDSSSDEPSFGN